MSKTLSGFRFGYQYVWAFANETDARHFFACDPRYALRTLEAWKCTEAIARIVDENGIRDLALIPKATLEVMASFEPMTGDNNLAAQLFFADTSLPAPILRTALEMTDSDDRWGIVRLSDERQVIMSSGMSGVLLAGVFIDETTQWKRPEFWHPEDLADFNNDWRRQLDVEGAAEIERRYRIHKPRSNDPWEFYTSRYRLIQADGDLFHLGVFVGRG